jgi:hypothetical protein
VFGVQGLKGQGHVINVIKIKSVYFLYMRKRLYFFCLYLVKKKNKHEFLFSSFKSYSKNCSEFLIWLSFSVILKSTCHSMLQHVTQQEFEEGF